ncbi:MAG: DUF29 domain-containing protein [bacterium]
MINITTKTKIENLSELYHTDYYTWAITNAQFLKEGRLDEIDYINLAEEVKDLGISEFKELRSYFANLLSHLYKWDNQPELRSKSWRNTIKHSLIQIEDVIKDNPGLKPQIDKAYNKAWNEAANIIFKDTQGKLDVPEDLPYSLKEAIIKTIEITGIDKSSVSFLKN